MMPLLLNYLRMGKGESFFMAANEPHAYLKGDILEVRLRPTIRHASVSTTLLLRICARQRTDAGQILQPSFCVDCAMVLAWLDRAGSSPGCRCLGMSLGVLVRICTWCDILHIRTDTSTFNAFNSIMELEICNVTRKCVTTSAAPVSSMRRAQRPLLP